MSKRRVLASSLAVVLATFSIGSATAWFSDSVTLQYQISAATDFADDEEEEKVWVCKLLGPLDDPWVKDGKNPIHVEIGSTDAENGFSDAHPSYIVESGDVECQTPSNDAEGDSDEGTESVGIDEQSRNTRDSPSTTTSTTTTTAPESTQTTTSTLPLTTTTTTFPTTTTTIPDNDQSTASVTTTTSTSSTTTTTIGSTGTDE